MGDGIESDMVVEDILPAILVLLVLGTTNVWKKCSSSNSLVFRRIENILNYLVALGLLSTVDTTRRFNFLCIDE